MVNKLVYMLALGTIQGWVYEKIAELRVMVRFCCDDELGHEALRMQ